MSNQQQFPTNSMPYVVPSQQPIPVVQTVSQDQKLHIKNIHESITEEILWSKFKEFGNIQKLKLARDRTTQKSKGYAKITFSTAQAAKKAKEDLNHKFLLNKEITGNTQKRILISKDLDHDKFAALKNKNIFLEGIPKEKIDPQDFQNHMSQYGEVLSLVLTTEKDNETLAGYGFILFEKEEDNDNLLAKGSIQYKDSQITVQKYLSQQKRTHEVKKSVYIKNFYKDLTDAESQSEESKKAAAEPIRAFLVDKLSQFGEIESCIVGFDPQTNKKAYAFLSMRDDKKLEQFIQKFSENRQEIISSLGFKEDMFINAEVNKPLKSIEDRFLLIRNLKAYETAEETQQQQQKLHDILSTFGQVESVSVFKAVKPQGASARLQDANQAKVIMATEDDATKVLINYLGNQQIRALFNNENPNGGITYLLPKSERDKMLRSKQIERVKNEQQFLSRGFFQTNQQLSQGQFPMQQMNNFNRGPQQRQRGPNQMYQRQQYNRQGYQQPRQNYSQPPQQQQAQRQQQQIQPKPIAQQKSAPQMQQQQQPQQQQQSQPITLEELKKNLEKFTKLDQKQQSQILGNLLFPKVESFCKQLNLEAQLAPKITGMLIDFTVFDITDIVEILENNEELKERIIEADSLIKQQQ